MARVVVKSLKAPRRGVGAGSVVAKTVHKPNGQRIKILSVDSNSPTFGSDLSVVFERNVAKARRENKKKLGSPDRAVQKA